MLAGLLVTVMGAGKEPGKSRSVKLDLYRSSGNMSSVPGARANASGITYNANSGTLFVVLNYPAKLIEFTAGGKKKRDIKLDGFLDPEGIVWMKDRKFAVVEEGRGTICVFDIEPGTSEINRDSVGRFEVERTMGNKGLEGIAYDDHSEVFYVIKEKHPRKIYRVTAEGKITNPWDAEKHSFGLSDISDIYFDAVTGHLLILSHESRRVVECTVNGKEISRLKINMPKPEGITMDGESAIYICGEPDDLRKYAADGL